MLSRAKSCNAKKVTVDGVNFDSIYESEIYKFLKRKILSTNNPSLKLSIHHPIHFTGGRELSQVYKESSWKVDFVVIDTSKDNTPVCGIEAKGRFFPQDKFKFLLWDLFQSMPLIVVYQGRKPQSLLSHGWLTFVSTSMFKNLDLTKQIKYKVKTNKLRNQHRQ